MPSFSKKRLFVKIIIFILILITLHFFLVKKLTQEKIENKIIQTKTKIEAALSREVAPTQSETEGLNSHLIKTVFIQQAPEKNWDDPWQDACEEASLLTVDYFYKNISSITIETNRNAILKMIDFENTQNFSKDMNVSQMAVVASKYLNYQTKIIDNPTIDDIKRYISQNTPIIIPASGKILYQENKHFNSGGPYYHNIVILGYDDQKQQFTVHDVGTKAGAYFKYSYNLLMESIHDFPASDKKEDINDGQKRILVLLK